MRDHWTWQRPFLMSDSHNSRETLIGNVKNLVAIGKRNYREKKLSPTGQIFGRLSNYFTDKGGAVSPGMTRHAPEPFRYGSDLFGYAGNIIHNVVEGVPFPRI